MTAPALEKQPEVRSLWRRGAGSSILLLLVAALVVGLTYRDLLLARMARVLASGDEDPVPTRRLERVSFQLEVPATGEITGLASLPVPTPSTRSGGLKVAWLAPEGSIVQAGQPIVRFDSTDARLNLEKHENTLASNTERFKITEGKQSTDERVLGIDRTDAQKEYDYAITVMPQDETIFSKWDIIEARINANFAKEKIGFLTAKGRVQKRIARSDMQILAIEKNKAQAEITIARDTLNSLELRAPKAGLVLYRRDRMRDPQVGDESWPGQVLVELVDLDSLQARIYVLERDAGSLTPDKPVVIQLDSIPEKQFHGVIRTVATLAQPLERNSPLKYFNCDVSVKDASQDLRRIKPGMSLLAKVILEKYDSCFVLPASAVTAKGTESLVYVKEAESFRAIPVTLGVGTHGQAVVLDGLQENQVIAMRNPFEERKLRLPDFSKATAQPGGMGGMRIIMR